MADTLAHNGALGRAMGLGHCVPLGFVWSEQWRRFVPIH